ncbi:hypothetical protein GUJ93_ZPchr0008g12564 [Zizania palustris]|uniref:Uncharacterized protein n=1 Tax=Zizania palustris TaxID=103762 RepID=A0A8J5V5J3_ZIZPA|nr:hypothetical protein GUJ93_ZPchr0008g12564 [Zizania palustris]
MDYQPKVTMHKLITSSLHSVHRILDDILDRIAFDDRVDRGYESVNHDPRGGLKFIASEAHGTHELAKEVQCKFSSYMEMQTEEKSRMESMISSLLKENQDIRSILKIAVTEKEAAESSLCALKRDRDQGRSAVLQIAEKGLQRSDCDHLQLLAAEQAQKIIKHESHIKDLGEREAFLFSSVEELTVGIKEVEQEAARWKEACELEVEAGKVAIKELKQEVSFQVALLTEELKRIKADLEAANSKLDLKEKLATSAMAAQAAADACLKLADSRSAGLQLRIEELTRQIEQGDEHASKERGSSHRRIRYVCWPWHRLRVISASSRANTWFVDQNGRLPPGTEALLQMRI